MSPIVVIAINTEFDSLQALASMCSGDQKPSSVMSRSFSNGSVAQGGRVFRVKRLVSQASAVSLSPEGSSEDLAGAPPSRSSSNLPFRFSP